MRVEGPESQSGQGPGEAFGRCRCRDLTEGTSDLAGVRSPGRSGFSAGVMCRFIGTGTKSWDGWPRRKNVPTGKTPAFGFPRSRVGYGTLRVGEEDQWRRETMGVQVRERTRVGSVRFRVSRGDSKVHRSREDPVNQRSGSLDQIRTQGRVENVLPRRTSV